ncbi:MAG: ribbon-helix-helix protein, CopG family [Longimicrobiales bacterium]|nr:ribbon-helix-helix protein, CopG family [Longimicrobiales bacterium]
MRTTVELSDEIRAKLLELAARRGERGFSAIVEEAVERYLREEEGKQALIDEARSVLGTMTEEDGRALEESVRKLREGRWR